MEEAVQSTRKFKKNYYNYNVLFLTLFIVCFGLVIIYSASSYTASIKYNDEFRFVKSQARGIVLGLVAMLIISRPDYRILKQDIIKIGSFKLKPLWILYLMALFFQTFVLFKGVESHGAKRWLQIGPIQFQPAEVSKIATIVVVAFIIQLAPRAMDKVSGYVRILIYIAPLLMLIAIENLSSAIIIFLVLTGVCFVASRKKWYYFAAIIVIGLLVALFIIFGDPFRMERFDVWWHVETHPKGFQTLQGLYAIASGGMFGSGLGQSMQKLGYIPEAQNDMIFTVICEELGLVGAAAVMIMFILLLWNIMLVAEQAPDLFGSLICIGVMMQIAVQVILNIAVVTNSVPNTGVSLPFISCGGTAVSILMAEMGLVLSVSRQVRR